MAGTEVVTTLLNSPSTVAAGLGEVLQVLAAAVTNSTPPAPPAKPIMITYGDRVMALGRKRLSVLNGRNAMVYVKSKFGLLSASRPVQLNASFIGNEEDFVEVDMDAWEELVPHIARLKLCVEN